MSDFWWPWAWLHNGVAFLICRGDWLHGWRRTIYGWLAAKAYWEYEMREMRKAGPL